MLYALMVISSRSAVKNACQMLMNLGIDSRCVYAEDFETPFLSQSAEFYQVCTFLLDSSSTSYLSFLSLKVKNY
jgi:cullin 3